MGLLKDSPEFETWSQGIHARSGVACADCHMPYMREGSLKIRDHNVRSPLLNILFRLDVVDQIDERIQSEVARVIETRLDLLFPQAVLLLSARGRSFLY